MKNKTSSEHSEQTGFVNWFRYKYPNIIIFAIPNGGFRSIRTAKLLKEEGVVPGIPDLFIPSLKIFVEMKRVKGGVVSPEQKKMMEYLTRVGYTCMICYGANDASRQLLDFLKDKK